MRFIPPYCEPIHTLKMASSIDDIVQSLSCLGINEGLTWKSALEAEITEARTWITLRENNPWSRWAPMLGTVAPNPVDKFQQVDEAEAWRVLQ